MDIASWGLGRTDWPADGDATGGKYIWKDDQETPNTLMTALSFGEVAVGFEVRNLPTPTEALAPLRPGYVGNIFMGDKGFITVDHSGFQLYKSAAADMTGEKMREMSAGSLEKYEPGEGSKSSGDDTAPHMKNFLDAVRSRDYKSLHAEVEIGTHSADFCHLGNIATAPAACSSWIRSPAQPLATAKPPPCSRATTASLISCPTRCDVGSRFHSPAWRSPFFRGANALAKGLVSESRQRRNAHAGLGAGFTLPISPAHRTAASSRCLRARAHGSARHSVPCTPRNAR